MFSQFRNAVEQLAQPIRDASSLENHSEPPARSGSLDIQAGRSTSPLSSSELAESALSSLRKSLASQRSSSPLQSVKTPGSPSPPENTRPRKSNLEERLRRATFAIGDASGSPTPTQSSRVASPSPMSSDRKPMPPKVQEQSPHSTPLPSSPMVAPASEVSPKVEQPSKLLSEEEKSTLSSEETKSKDSEVHAEVTNKVSQTTSLPDNPIEEKETSEQIPAADAQSLSVDTQLSSANTQPSSSEVHSFSADAQTSSLDFATSSRVETVEATAQENTLTSSPIESTSQGDLQVPALDTDAASIIEDIFLEQNSPPISDSNSAHQEPSPINEKALAKEKMSTTDEESPSKLEAAPVENAAVEESVNDEGHAQESVVCPPIVDNSAELESLQTRLKQVEQRFSGNTHILLEYSRCSFSTDVSKSFKRLQAEKLAADAVLREATPLESIKDADGLRELFKNLKAKDDVSRLNYMGLDNCLITCPVY
jgi:hypothetical protein